MSARSAWPACGRGAPAPDRDVRDTEVRAHKVLFAKLEVIYVIIHIMYFNQIHKEDLYNAT